MAAANCANLGSSCHHTRGAGARTHLCARSVRRDVRARVSNVAEDTSRPDPDGGEFVPGSAATAASWPRGDTPRKMYKKADLDEETKRNIERRARNSPYAHNSLYVTNLRDKIKRVSRREYMRLRREAWVEERKGDTIFEGRIREQPESSFENIYKTSYLRSEAPRKDYGTKVIHDFCFGATLSLILLGSWLFGLLCGFGGVVYPLIHGVIHATTNSISYALWSKRCEHRPLTLLSFVHSWVIFAGTGKVVVNALWSMTPMQPTLFTWVFAVGSLWASLFYLKCLVRGGNPPPKDVAWQEWGVNEYGIPYSKPGDNPLRKAAPQNLFRLKR
ncbi:hypothetical protein PPROV_000282500 [Pycnococcus provasolii]|uniref:Uncharacterized protein n=1 Tax=Pycnococcus provasolii TaxID=41880 RepID=A0A830HEQ0_9CHLO|nr:hypothetical protein PPROV_000282500 [Pycnococcus provasolii]